MNLKSKNTILFFDNWKTHGPTHASFLLISDWHAVVVIPNWYFISGYLKGRRRIDTTLDLPCNIEAIITEHAAHDKTTESQIAAGPSRSSGDLTLVNWINVFPLWAVVKKQ